MTGLRWYGRSLLLFFLHFFPNGVFDYAVNLSQKSYSKRNIARNAEIRARNADGIKKDCRFRVFFVQYYQRMATFVISIGYRSFLIFQDIHIYSASEWVFKVYKCKKYAYSSYFNMEIM